MVDDEYTYRSGYKTQHKLVFGGGRGLEFNTYCEMS